MSHGFTTEHDTMVSYSGVKPWHQFGNVLEGSPKTIEDAIDLSGLNFTVSLEEQYAKINGQELLCPTSAVVRTYPDGQSDVIATVGKKYKLYQNRDAFEFFQPFIDEGFATIETAGCIFNGCRVWVLCKINTEHPDMILKDDPVNRYILLGNSHDGSLAIHVGFVPIRVVCNNTLGFAVSSVDAKILRVHHKGNVKKNMESIQETMSIVNQGFEATMEQFRALTKKPINQSDLENYVKVVFTYRKKKSVSSDYELDYGNNLDDKKILVSKITEIYNTSETIQGLRGVEGTWWGAYNALTEFTTHHRSKSLDKRFDETMFRDINTRALNTALALAV